MGLGFGRKPKPPRKSLRRYPELTTPGEKVQTDVKEVSYNCLKGKAKRDGRHLYQAIEECTRLRYVYGYWEHTLENPVDFLGRFQATFPFPIQTTQTDNGAKFMCRFISEKKKCPFKEALEAQGIAYKPIPPRMPWHNGKVERSHRNDQRYLYDWEKFGDGDELNRKLAVHLEWSNNKTMRALGRKSPLERLKEFQVMTISRRCWKPSPPTVHQASSNEKTIPGRFPLNMSHIIDKCRYRFKIQHFSP
jgi:hypothetical protein